MEIMHHSGRCRDNGYRLTLCCSSVWDRNHHTEHDWLDKCGEYVHCDGYGPDDDNEIFDILTEDF